MESFYSRFNNNFPEYQFIQLINNDNLLNLSINAIHFDLYEELLWVGNQGGHVNSYFSTDLIKYTSFQINNSEEIRCLTTSETSLLALTSNNIKILTRQGIPQFSSKLLTEKNFEAKCILIPQYLSCILIGGLQNEILKFDLHRPSYRTNIKIDYDSCEMIKNNENNIFTVHSNGKISIRTLEFKHIKEIETHQTLISDIDISGNTLVVCGLYDRNGQMTYERFVKIYDLRTYKSLPPAQINIDPFALKFLKTYTERLLVVSQNGSYQLIDPKGGLTNSSIIYNFETRGSLISCLSSSSNGRALAFGDSAGFVQLYDTDKNGTLNGALLNFNNFSRSTLLPDIPVFDNVLSTPVPFPADHDHDDNNQNKTPKTNLLDLQSLALDGNISPMPSDLVNGNGGWQNVLPLPFTSPHLTHGGLNDLPYIGIDDYAVPFGAVLSKDPVYQSHLENNYAAFIGSAHPTEPLASDWPLKFIRKHDRRCLPIEEELLQNMKVSQFVGYVPAPQDKPRNIVPYDPSILSLQEKESTNYTYYDSLYNQVFPDAPVYYDELDPKHNQANLRKSDRQSPKLNLLKESPHKSSNSLILIPQIYSKQKLRVDWKSPHHPGQHCEKVNFHNYNPTPFPTLEAGSANTYINSIIQIFYFIIPLRSHILNHSCPKEYCISCELSFLFHMMNMASDNEPSQPLNLLRAFKNIPETSALGLIIEEQDIHHNLMVHSKLNLSQHSSSTLDKSSNSVKSSPIKSKFPRTDDKSVGSGSESDLPDDQQHPYQMDSFSILGRIIKTQPISTLIQNFIRFLIPQMKNDFSLLLNNNEKNEISSQQLESKNSTKPWESKTATNSDLSSIDELFGSNVLTKLTCCECLTNFDRESLAYTFTFKYPPYAKYVMGSRRYEDTKPELITDVKSFEEFIDRAIHYEAPTRSFCEHCKKFQYMEQSKQALKLPLILTFNTQTSDTLTQNFWTLKSETFSTKKANWIPTKITFSRSQNGYYNIQTDDTTPISSTEDDLHYDLLAIVVEVQDHEKESHLVDLICLDEPKVYPNAKAWYLFNDFCVFTIKQLNALDFSPCWKHPCILFYARSGINDIAVQVNNPINSTNLSKLLKSTSSFSSTLDIHNSAHLNNILAPTTSFGREKLSGIPVVPLNFGKEESFDPTRMFVCLDAEFVVLNRQESHLHSDGSHTTVKPGRLAVARISCVRGYYPNLEEFNSELEGVPFLDEYIAVPGNQVADYVTRYSGIQRGDLEIHTSSKNPVGFKAVYFQLRYLVDCGFSFCGHNIMKDFQIINITVPHTQIIDTAILFSLPKKRIISLKFLIWYYFGKTIQRNSHDSVEDATSALKLYKLYLELNENIGADKFTQNIKELYTKGHALNWEIPISSES